MKKLLVIAALAGLTGSAMADATWTGNASDGEWDTIGNWNAIAVAGVVTIDDASAVVHKAAGNDANVGDIFLKNGALNLSGHIGGGMMRIGQEEGTSGDVTVLSGDGTFAGWQNLSTWGFSLGEWSELASTFNNNGGTAKLAVDGAWFVVGANATMNLNGGYTIVDAPQSQFILNGVIDLAGGALAIKGDVLTEAAGWILAQNMTSYGQTADASDYTEKFAFDYDTTNAGYTTIAAIPEPSTLGMVTLLGGGMIWIRKRRFMI